VPGVPLFLADPNGHIDPNKQFLLNRRPGPMRPRGSGVSQPPTTGDYRGRRGPGETAALGRIFHIWEKTNVEIRGEFFNIFNRIGVPARLRATPAKRKCIPRRAFRNPASGT